ncbi:hypothetical protein [Nocardia jiangxiensis]|uniref:hypothetical protein n=1 Tax=Nocardia jiangxiensis TaxID=282685 RepID=UPI00030C57AA|nr:hypothetical protein [Nocardia jiangxiensis]
MIAMSFLAMMSTGFDGVRAKYVPAVRNALGRMSSPVVRVELNGVTASSLTLTIEDARTLTETLSQILMLHDAAERLAAEKAVA